MPKVPGSDYVSQVSVPGEAPFEKASGSALAAPFLAAEQGAKQLQAEGMLAQRHVQYIEAEKERQRQANEVVKKLNDATAFFGATEYQLQNGYTDVDGTKVPPVGSEKYESTLNSKFQDYKGGFINSADPVIRPALELGLNRMYQSRMIHAQHYATSLHVQEQESEDKLNAVESAKLAVAAPTPEEKDRIIQTYNAGLDVKYAGSRPKYVESLKENFAKGVQTAYMENLMYTNPMKFADLRDQGAFKDVPVHEQIRILDQYATRQNRAVAQEKQIYDANREMGRQQMYARFNRAVGTEPVSEFEMQTIAEGNHPYFDAKEYPELRRLRDNPPNGAGSESIRALRAEYLDKLGYRSLTGINSYQQRAVDMGKSLGAPNPELTKFMEELKSDWRSITSMGNVQTNKNVQIFKEDNEQDKKPSPFGGVMSNIAKDRERKYEAYGESLIRKYGYTPEAAADAVRKKREADTKARKGTLQDTIDSIQIKP